MITEIQDQRMYLVLMAMINTAGGTLLVPTEALQKLGRKIKALGNKDISIGHQTLPDGILLVNLLGDEEIDAWDAEETV